MKKIEVVQEVITVASILIKAQRDDILEKRDEFIEFVNTLYEDEPSWRRLNPTSFKKLIEGLTEDEKESLIAEFNEGYEDVYRYLEMYSTI